MLLLLNIILSIILFIFRNNSVVTVGMFNKSNVANKILLDFSQSKNLLFSTKSPKIEKVKFILFYFRLLILGNMNFSFTFIYSLMSMDLKILIVDIIYFSIL
jgi:hypothetical protein